MAAHFLLQIFQRFTQHIGHNANAGYHKQKVRHGFHLLSTEVLRNSVQPAATQWSAFHCRQTKLNHIYCCPSILFHAIIETTISKGKKFSYSFTCGKGYSPPKGGRIAFGLQSEARVARPLSINRAPHFFVLALFFIFATKNPSYHSSGQTHITPGISVGRSGTPSNAAVSIGTS